MVSALIDNAVVFFSNTAIQKAIFDFIGGYAAEKTLDSLISWCQKKGNKYPIETQLINALNESLQDTCEQFSLEYDSLAIVNTFIHHWELYDDHIMSTERLKTTLENATALNITDDVLRYWVSSFIKQISEKENSELYKYTLLQGVFFPSESKTYINGSDSINFDAILGSPIECINGIIWRTNPYSFRPVYQDTTNSNEILDISYKENNIIYSFVISVFFLDAQTETGRLESILNTASDFNTSVCIIEMLSTCPLDIRQSIESYATKHSVAILLDDKSTTDRYLLDLNGIATTKAFDILRERIIDTYKNRYNEILTLESFANDCFVDRVNERKELTESFRRAFFIQGVSLCGKTTLVKNVISTLTNCNNQKAFWHTIYEKQDIDIINTTFWNELCDFFLLQYKDASLQTYFHEKAHGYIITDNLIILLEYVFKRYDPIIVIDNIHNCQDKNYELKQIFELIVTRKLCKIYFIGWFNVFSYSAVMNSAIKKIVLGGMTTEYLSLILNHYTGESKPNIADLIYKNLSGLPGYAVIYDDRMPEDSFTEKNNVLEQILNLLGSDNEKNILFSLSIASTPIGRATFDKLMLLRSIDDLCKKNLIEKKVQGYIVHDNYKPFFSEYHMDYNTRINVINILTEAAKSNAVLFIDIINLYINYENHKMAYELLRENFYTLLHNDLTISLLSIIQKIERTTSQTNQVNLITKKVIIFERRAEYAQCEKYLEIIEDCVERNSEEFEELFYIKLRCMYFSDRYNEMTGLCNKKLEHILKFTQATQIQIFFLIGRVYYIQGDLQNAISSSLLCFEAALTTNSFPLMVKAIHRLAMIECCLGYFQESLYAFQIILERDKDITGRRRSFILYRIAKCYFLMNDPTNAKKYCEKAIEIKKSFGDIRGLSFVNKLLAKIYFREGNITDALLYIEKAIDLSRTAQIVKEDVAIYLVKATILISQEDYDTANSLLEFCLKNSTDMNLLFRIKQIEELTRGHMKLAEINKNAISIYDRVSNKYRILTEKSAICNFFDDRLSNISKSYISRAISGNQSGINNILIRANLTDVR